MTNYGCEKKRANVILNEWMERKDGIFVNVVIHTSK